MSWAGVGRGGDGTCDGARVGRIWAATEPSCRATIEQELGWRAMAGAKRRPRDLRRTGWADGRREEAAGPEMEPGGRAQRGGGGACDGARQAGVERRRWR